MWYGAAFDGKNQVLTLKSNNKALVQDTVHQAREYINKQLFVIFTNSRVEYEFEKIKRLFSKNKAKWI